MKYLEWYTIKSESLVIESYKYCIVSRVAWSTWNSVWIREDHLVRLNIPEWPIVKQYREGKVKRTPGGEWKEHETISLQAVGERFNVWLRSCWRMSRRLIGNGLVKVKNTGALAKASLKRAFVIISRPEPAWSNHDQDEASVKRSGGPNRLMLKNQRMSCGYGWNANRIRS